MENKIIPKIEVLLSTYNGEKYLESQIDSILNQQGVEIVLTVRDDGSTDRTLEILESYKAKWPTKIFVIEGENIGYRRSFLSLLAMADETVDYFAYADQDDVWELDKLKCAVMLLNGNLDSWLYASALKITDENLNIMSTKCLDDLRQTLGSFFVRTRLAGCTMVFTKNLLKIALKYAKLDVEHEMAPDHDCLLCMLSMIYGKRILYDTQSHILHRRHDAAETSGGRGVKNRIFIEKNRIVYRKHSYQYIAKLLLKEQIDWNQSSQVNNNRKLLEKIALYNYSVRNVIKLCFDSRIQCGIKCADILIRCKMLLRWY